MEEQTVYETPLDPITKFARSIREQYVQIDDKDELTVVIGLQELNGLIKSVFGINYHEISKVQSDGQSIKLNLVKK